MCGVFPLVGSRYGLSYVNLAKRQRCERARALLVILGVATDV